MINYFTVDQNGKVCGAGSTQRLELATVADGCVAIEGTPPQVDCCWYVNGEFHIAKDRNTTLNTETLEWVADMSAKILEATTLINAEREAKGYEPIAYSGSLFDADDKAQRNIQVWQTQIANGAVLPPNFVWIDKDNILHPADATFVNELGNSIALRGTMLYQKSWQIKAQIQACTTEAQLTALMATDLWADQ